jgi:hypothetical protein
VVDGQGTRQASRRVHPDGLPPGASERDGSLAAVGIARFERRLEQAVEGVFGRVFRSGLRPVEIGRRLVREMDDNRSVGVNGRVVVPNHFTVRLAPEDHERLAEVEDALGRELIEAAREHARDEGYGFMGPLGVEFSVDDRLGTGRFGLEGRLRAPEGGATAHLLLPTGEQVVLGEYLLSMGRLPECTITLGDPKVSRRHAEIRPHGDGWLLTDLGSTNGTLVNGSPVTSHRLLDGDEIQLGSTLIGFRLG